MNHLLMGSKPPPPPQTPCYMTIAPKLLKYLQGSLVHGVIPSSRQQHHLLKTPSFTIMAELFFSLLFLLPGGIFLFYFPAFTFGWFFWDLSAEIVSGFILNMINISDLHRSPLPLDDEYVSRTRKNGSHLWAFYGS